MSAFGILESRYRLVETRFEPGFIVLKAVDVAADAPVAIRTPGDEIRRSPRELHLFLERAERLVRLRGPACLEAELIPAGTLDDRPYLVTPWYDETLAEVLEREGEVALAYASRALLDVLSALATLHAAGLSHGSLGPRDFAVFGFEGALKLAALGGSRPDPEGSSYAPPPSAAGALSGPATDVYAAGMIGLRLLLGKAGFERVVAGRHRGHEGASLAGLAPALPASLVEVLAAMTELPPSPRSSDARKAHAAFEEALDVSRVTQATGTLRALEPEPAMPPEPAPERARALAEAPSFAPHIESPPRRRAPRGGTSVPIFKLALLVLLCAAVWLGFGVYRDKEVADALRAAAGQARSEAAAAGAGLNAARQLEAAESALERAERAHAAWSYAEAGGGFRQASELYGAALSMTRRARERALGAEVDATRSIEEAEVTSEAALRAIDGVKQELRAGEGLLESGAYEAAAARFEDVAERVGEIVARIEVEALLARAEDLRAGVPDAAADRLMQSATNLAEAGEPIGAAAYLRRAIAALEAGRARSERRSLEALRAEVLDLRRRAAAAGSDAGPGALAGERALAEAGEALTSGALDASRAALETARDAFEHALLHAGVLAARARVREAEAALAAGEGSSADPAHLEALRIGRHASERLAAGALEEALSGYERAAELLSELSERSAAAGVERIAALAGEAAERARAGLGEESVHYHRGMQRLAEAEEALAANVLPEARAGFEEAARLFERTLAESRALEAKSQALEARNRAEAAGVPSDAGVAARGARQMLEAAEAFSQQDYARAFDAYRETASAFAEALVSHRRGAAESARADAARVREGAAGAAALASHRTGEEHWHAGLEAMAEADFEGARAALERATQHFERAILEQGTADLRERVEARMAEAEALDAASVEAFSSAQARLRDAEAAREAGDHERAAAEYEHALALLDTAERTALAHRARSARDAALAVRASVARHEAAQTASFTRATATFERGRALLEHGEHEKAREAFEASQAQFVAAGDEWAAAQSRHKMVAARDAASRAGISRDAPPFETGARQAREAEASLGAGELARAAELYVAATRSFELARENAERTRTEEARARAGAAAEQAQRARGLDSYARAAEKMAEAERAAARGLVPEALELFADAEQGFSLSAEDARVREAREAARGAREAALAGGVAPAAEAFLTGVREETRGDTLHAADAYAEAHGAYAAAGAAFESALADWRARTRPFVAGTSERQLEAVLALCREHAESCTRNAYASEAPRSVRLAPFVLDEHEVTNEQFRAFVEASGHRTEAEKLGYSMAVRGQIQVKAPGQSWRAPFGEGSTAARYPRHPVVHVSLADAEAYCAWAGGRLPTEDEWEYAARGDDPRLFPWGDEWGEGRVRWAGDADAGTLPAVSFPEAATPEGLHDMAGSVWEWARTPTAPGAVLKGGSWLERNPTAFRGAAKRLHDPARGRSDVGFRCAYDVADWP